MRPYWPQTASGFEVRFQIRVCHFCLLPEKCEFRFIGKFFTFFKNVPWKSTKFPFHRRITRLCSLIIAWEFFQKPNREFQLKHRVRYSLTRVLKTFWNIFLQFSNSGECSFCNFRIDKRPNDFQDYFLFCNFCCIISAMVIK